MKYDGSPRLQTEVKRWRLEFSKVTRCSRGHRHGRQRKLQGAEVLHVPSEVDRLDSTPCSQPASNAQVTTPFNCTVYLQIPPHHSPAKIERQLQPSNLGRMKSQTDNIYREMGNSAPFPVFWRTPFLISYSNKARLCLEASCAHF